MGPSGIEILYRESNAFERVDAVVKKNEKLREKIAETLELPKDIVMDVPKITIIGNIQLNIENHLGIVEYSSKTIRINTTIGMFKINGENMIIRNITAEEITIEGKIENLDVSN